MEYLAEFEHVFPISFQVNANSVVFENNFCKAIFAKRRNFDNKLNVQSMIFNAVAEHVMKNAVKVNFREGNLVNIEVGNYIHFKTDYFCPEHIQRVLQSRWQRTLIAGKTAV